MKPAQGWSTRGLVETQDWIVAFEEPYGTAPWQQSVLEVGQGGGQMVEALRAVDVHSQGWKNSFHR